MSPLQHCFNEEVNPWLNLAEDLRAVSLDNELSLPEVLDYVIQSYAI